MPNWNNFFDGTVRAFTSDRDIDFSFTAQKPGLNSSQIEYLSAYLNIDVTHNRQISQVHGNHIASFSDLKTSTDEIKEADGLITNLKKTALIIRTADCLPIFIYDSLSGSIGLVHAGWRGSYQDIVIKAIEMMGKEFNSVAKNIKILFGPCIGPCCYEVGIEFKEYFSNEIILRSSKYFVDLKEVNKNKLISAGILEENIKDTNICTCCNEQYFSFRRQGDKAGRMLSLLMLI